MPAWPGATSWPSGTAWPSGTNWPGATSWPSGSSPSPLVIMAGQLAQYVSLAPGMSVATLDTNTTTTVTALTDLGVSPNNFSSGVKATQPLYTAIDSTHDNQPSFTCDGVNDQLFSAYNIPTPGTTPYAVFGVIKCVTFITNGFIYADNSSVGGSGAVFTPAASTLRVQSGATGATSAAPGGWFMFYAEFSNSALDVLKVGANAAVAGNAGNAVPQAGRAIGSAGSVAYGNVAVSELGIYLGARGTFPWTAYRAWVNAVWPTTAT